jgi:hypothetical protein
MANRTRGTVPPLRWHHARNTVGAGLKHPTSVALREHWEASCRGPDLPHNRSFQLHALGPAITDAFTIEAPIRDGTYGFCGGALALRYGRDLVGESFLARWSAEDRIVLDRHLHAMASGGAGIVLGLTAETAAGGFTSFEVLLLPVAHEGGIGAVGSMARVGGHDDANRIRARIVAQFLRSVRVLEPPRPNRLPKPLGGYPLPPRKRNPGHLTLVAGRK